MNQRLSSEINKIIMSLLIKNPFFGLLLKSIPIYASSEIKFIRIGKGYIIINPEVFLRLSKEDMIYVLLHALTHLVLLHPFRVEELSKKYDVDPILLNYLSEITTDSHVITIKHPKNIIPRTQPKEQLIKNLANQTLEEAVKTLQKDQHLREIILSSLNLEETKSKILFRIDLPDIELELPPKQSPLLAGSKKIVEALYSKDASKIKKQLIEVIVDSYMTAKQAGVVPGWVERLVNDLLEPQINWRALLRFGLRKSLGQRIRRTYSRPNKKYVISGYYLFPSKKYYGGFKALILVDTSGSIENDTLSLFFSEIYGIFRFGNAKEITVIPWDARVHETIRIRNILDFKNIKVTGMGGTKLTPAIKKALEIVDNQTVVIIFSDFEISELEDKKRMETLKKNMVRLARRSLRAIMVTTSKKLKIPYWDIISVY